MSKIFRPEGQAEDAAGGHPVQGPGGDIALRNGHGEELRIDQEWSLQCLEAGHAGQVRRPGPGDGKLDVPTLDKLIDARLEPDVRAVTRPEGRLDRDVAVREGSHPLDEFQRRLLALSPAWIGDPESKGDR